MIKVTGKLSGRIDPGRRVLLELPQSDALVLQEIGFDVEHTIAGRYFVYLRVTKLTLADEASYMDTPVSVRVLDNGVLERVL